MTTVPVQRWSDLAVGLLGGRLARRLAAALLAYGIGGLALLISGGLVAAPMLATVDALATAASGSRREAVATVDAAVTAFDGLSTSLIQGQESISAAALAAREAAGTARGLATAMDITVLGTRPFLPLSSGFGAQSDQLAALASELDDLGRSLLQNQEDVATIRSSLGAVRRQLDALGPLPIGAAPLVPLAYGMLLWLAVPAVASTWLGAALWRHTTAG